MQLPLWAVTEDPTTGCHGELCVSGSRVVWYEGLHPHNRTVRKVYSVESEILQAFWCEFREEGVCSSDGKSRRGSQSLRCVCVREHSCLTFFMQTGAVYYIPLPFLVSGLVALQVGIHPSLHLICHSSICPSLFIQPTSSGVLLSSPSSTPWMTSVLQPSADLLQVRTNELIIERLDVTVPECTGLAHGWQLKHCHQPIIC